MSRKNNAEELRSHRWYGVRDLRSFGHRSRTKQMGYAAEDYRGKPIIAVVNTWSDINPATPTFGSGRRRSRGASGRREASLWSSRRCCSPSHSRKPSTMLYRNFLAMETEELLRSYPIDGAGLMGGCDKTTPALLIGAISMNVPAICFPGARGNSPPPHYGRGYGLMFARHTTQADKGCDFLAQGPAVPEPEIH